MLVLALYIPSHLFSWRAPKAGKMCASVSASEGGESTDLILLGKNEKGRAINSAGRVLLWCSSEHYRKTLIERLGRAGKLRRKGIKKWPASSHIHRVTVR